jgi:hypothetical protein
MKQWAIDEHLIHSVRFNVMTALNLTQGVPVATPKMGLGMGVFSDEVFTSSDLNRRISEVLNHASNRPVTISRNNEQFALLRRDQAADLVRAVSNFSSLVEVVQAAVAIKRNEAIPQGASWMAVLPEGDRISMLQELFTASHAALDGDGDWETVSTALHEWRETASLLSSKVLDEAMSAAPDEQPLTDPRAVPVEEPELAVR